ncbi:hypothetical protein D3C74_362590 [compost metagenome]
MGSGIIPASALEVIPTCSIRPRLRNEFTAAWQVAAIPKASTATWTPPLVSSRICSTTSPSLALTVATAPRLLASASASSLISTAITWAPEAAAIWIADRPTPPQPCTDTHSPGLTATWSTTPWKAVMKRQPNPAAASKLTFSGRRIRLRSPSGTLTYRP